MKTIAFGVVTFSAACLMCQSASAASFNCGSAGLTKTEQEICRDASLSALDSKLASAYSAAKVAANDSDKVSITNAQKAWVARRNQCMDTACLIESYNSRIAQLSSSATGATQAVGVSAAKSVDSQSPSGTGVSNAMSAITPSYLSSLDIDITASSNAARALLGKQIGFKDYRLGKTINTAQEIPGIKSCVQAIQVAQPGPDFHAEAAQALHDRWDAHIKDFSQCDANTTVLEKPASVSLLVMGDPGVTVGVLLTVDSTDLDAISGLLTKSLGAPKDTKITTTPDEALKQIQQDELKQCDVDVANTFRNSVAVAGQEVARCHGQMQGRVLMRMAQVPTEGIIQGSRVWTVEGAQVGYKWVNVGEHPTTVIQFIVDKAQITSKKLTEAFLNDVKNQEAVAKKAESAAKSKDF